MTNLIVRLVALPIGNVGDLSARARSVLESATRIYCEDTRKLKELAARADLTLRARVTALPGDSEFEMDWNRELAAGAHGSTEHWVLVSDAGTPVVNDPGRSLLDFCQRKDIRVEAIPGPCAPVLAWQWSGGFGLPFVFAGFAPKAKSAGAKELDDFFSRIPRQGTFCFFDTRHQVLVTLEHLRLMQWGQQRLVVAREMTKTHEEQITGNVDFCFDVLNRRLSADEPLGELTLLLEAGAPTTDGAQIAAADLEELYAIRSQNPKQAAKVMARLSGKSTAECYQFLISKRSDPGKKGNES